MKRLAFADNNHAGRLSRSNLVVVFFSQLAVLAITATLIACFRGTWVLSFLAGGSIHILPVTYFGWMVFKDSNVASVSEFVRVFYRGETVKFFLTALGFVMAFHLVKPLYVPALFAGYSLMLAAHIIGVARFSR